MRNLRTTVGVFFLTSLLRGAPAYGQKDTTGSPQPKPGALTEKIATADGQDHAIKVRVNEVIVPVTILDSNGGDDL
jgi:hypothetical protein